MSNSESTLWWFTFHNSVKPSNFGPSASLQNLLNLTLKNLLQVTRPFVSTYRSTCFAPTFVCLPLLLCHYAVPTPSPSLSATARTLCMINSCATVSFWLYINQSIPNLISISLEKVTNFFGRLSLSLLYLFWKIKKVWLDYLLGVWSHLNARH